MTARAFVTIWCDYDAEPLPSHLVCHYHIETGERRAAAARRAALAAGWRWVGRRMDACPAHAAYLPESVAEDLHDG